MSDRVCSRTEAEQCLGSEVLYQLFQKNPDSKGLLDPTSPPRRWPPIYQAELERQRATQPTSMSAPASPCPIRRSYDSNVAWYREKELLSSPSALLRPPGVPCKGLFTRPNSSLIENDQDQHIQNVSKGPMLKTSCNIARLHILTKEEKTKRETGYVAYSVPRGKDPGRTYSNSHGNISICQMVDSSQPWESSACRPTQPFAADETAPAPFNSSATHHIHFPTADIPQKFSQSEGNHIIKDTDPVSNPFFHCRQWLRGVPDDRSDNHCNDATTFSHRKFEIVENTLSTCERPSWPMSRVNCSCSMENSRRRWFGVHEEQLTSNLPRCLQVGQACSISEISSESIAHMTPSTSLPRTIHCQRQDSCPRSSRGVPIDMLLLGSSMPECVKTLNNYPNLDMKKAFTQPERSRQGCVKSATSGDLPKSLQVQRKTANQSELHILNSDPGKPLLTSQKLVSSDSKLDKSEIGNRKNLRFKRPQEGHKWALRELGFFVKHFPHLLPVLTSPAIAFLCNSKERDLLRPLRVIFPMAAEKVLSSLCATVIARNYLLSILQLGRQRSLWKCHKIPTIHRAAAKAGDDLAAQSRLCSFDQDGHIPDPRGAKICLEIDKIICHLIFTIVG